MTDKIDELAEELGNEIEQLAEYQEFLTALKAYENNDEAQELLSDLRRVENELISAHQKQEPHEEHEELHDEYEELEQQLMELSVVSDYYDTVEVLEEKLSEINNTISENLRIDFAHSVE